VTIYRTWIEADAFQFGLHGAGESIDLGLADRVQRALSFGARLDLSPLQLWCPISTEFEPKGAKPARAGTFRFCRPFADDDKRRSKKSRMRLIGFASFRGIPANSIAHAKLLKHRVSHHSGALLAIQE
jgi:hypothetical protein